MKKIDWYIIKKFLGTFFFTMILIIVIVIIFDISEKLDDFLKNQAPLKEIVFSYYLTFIPYFTNMFSSLFTFIAVVFFTSKIAANTEIIAILSSGISFRRLLRPYLVAATFLAVLSFYLANFLIPQTNKIRYAFEDKYIFSKHNNNSRNIHVQNSPGTLLYVESFNNDDNRGRGFTMEKVSKHQMFYKMKARDITFDSLSNSWEVHHYMIYNIALDSISYEYGDTLAIALNVIPSDFSSRIKRMDVMNYFELDSFIESEKIKGSKNIKFYEVERHKRVSFPFATLILTIIGASLSSRKSRGGIGLHLAFGILISFAYIIFMQISTVFATFGTLSPFVAVWIPNFLFAILAVLLVRLAPK
ncbi:MAG: LptF/LptG family permease [Bacteroidales bacterium]|nr:LptF/LptG family permease [Bacteroidales bacterium]